MSPWPVTLHTFVVKIQTTVTSILLLCNTMRLTTEIFSTTRIPAVPLRRHHCGSEALRFTRLAGVPPTPFHGLLKQLVVAPSRASIQRTATKDQTVAVTQTKLAVVAVGADNGLSDLPLPNQLPLRSEVHHFITHLSN